MATAPRSSKDSRGESQLVEEHGSEHLPGQGRRRGEAACPAANWIAARVVMSHRGDETDAEAERGVKDRGQGGGGQDDAAAGEAAAELVARPGHPAADRAGGQRSRRAASSSVSPSK